MSEAFQMGALALTGIVTPPEAVQPQVVKTIACKAENRELLFYEWLNALIFTMDTEHILFSRFNFREFSDRELKAEIWGEPVDRKKHDPAVEIKGATMTELKVEKENSSWVAQCVVDV